VGLGLGRLFDPEMIRPRHLPHMPGGGAFFRHFIKVRFLPGVAPTRSRPLFCDRRDPDMLAEVQGRGTQPPCASDDRAE